MKYTLLISLLLLTARTDAAECIQLFGDSLTASLVRSQNGSGFCSANGQIYQSSQVNSCINIGGRNIGGHAVELNRLTGLDVFTYARTNFTISQMFSTVVAGNNASQCDTSVILLGTNDVVQGTALETAQQNLEQTVALLSKDSRVLVIELPPLVGSNKQAFQPRVNALNKYIRESFNFVDLSPLDSEWVARYSSPDNLHLSKEGSEKIAELIVETLARPEPNSGVVLPPIIYLLLLDQS